MLSGEPINGLLDSRVSRARYHTGINVCVVGVMVAYLVPTQTVRVRVLGGAPINAPIA